MGAEIESVRLEDDLEIFALAVQWPYQRHLMDDISALSDIHDGPTSMRVVKLGAFADKTLMPGPPR